ncbi:MAG: hypothetical protein AAF939_21195 [Planctomycetota bacterium]
MINFAIFKKTIKDSAWTIAFAAAGVIGFVILIVFSMLNIGTEVLQFVKSVGFIRKIFEATLGINVEGDISINTLFSVSFTHGMVLMLTWGTIIAAATRVTVGEIEKGTADLLLTLPITRTESFLSTTLAGVIITAVMSICPIVGVAIGIQIFETEEVVELRRYVAPTINFFAINLAIFGVSTMIGCLIHRRGPCVGVIVAVAFFSVVLNFVEPFLPDFQVIGYFGLLHYFRPVDIVRTETWPINSMVTLLAIFASTIAIGMATYCRKDIPTA